MPAGMCFGPFGPFCFYILLLPLISIIDGKFCLIWKIQVYTEVSSLIELCRVQLKAVQLTSSMPASDMVRVAFSSWKHLIDFLFVINVFFENFKLQRNALAGLPEILVSTPACIPKCFAAGVLEPTAVSESLEILVLDEVWYMCVN